ncbi:MAG: ABC transporter permease subunit [Desulfomonilia bacterium]|jgi:Cu-processing system permease protein|nr:ABC transporter permease [Deltaproteobacteria bacterium]MDX9761276.1 ABC transporter permease subunit [Desulfomonilia bacterium]
MTKIRTVGHIMMYELLMNIRNKWVLGFSIGFALLALGVSYFGMALIGYEVEFQDFYRTVASLLNMVIYLIPVVALVMGVNSLCIERGTMDMLLAQPVSRSQVFLGKIGGLYITLFITTMVGLGTPGIIIALKSGYDGMWKYLIFALLCLAMAAMFVSISALTSILVRGKTKALVITLLLWVFFVLFYDLIVFALSYYMVDERYLRTMLYFSLLANPVDIIRVLTLMIIGGASALGPAGAGLIRQFGGVWAGISLSAALILLWNIAPLAAAVWVFKRRDIV